MESNPPGTDPLSSVEKDIGNSSWLDSLDQRRTEVPLHGDIVQEHCSIHYLPDIKQEADALRSLPRFQKVVCKDHSATEEVLNGQRKRDVIEAVLSEETSYSKASKTGRKRTLFYGNCGHSDLGNTNIQQTLRPLPPLRFPRGTSFAAKVPFKNQAETPDNNQAFPDIGPVATSSSSIQDLNNGLRCGHWCLPQQVSRRCEGIATRTSEQAAFQFPPLWYSNFAPLRPLKASQSTGTIASHFLENRMPIPRKFDFYRGVNILSPQGGFPSGTSCLRTLSLQGVVEEDPVKVEEFELVDDAQKARVLSPNPRSV